MAASEDAKRTAPMGLIGETDLARVDAYVLQPEDYDELPELTDEMFARGVPGNDPEAIRRLLAGKTSKPT